MENIPLPNPIEVTPVEGEDNRAEIVVSPCYPGYGTTLGNAMRRVLLSSLPGGAVTAVKIKGADHEFSTLNGVKEDVVEIILNIKSLRFACHSEEPVEIELSKKGEGEVTAADFSDNSDVEVINSDQVIATLTDSSAEFSMKVIVQRGRGYVAVEEREDEELELGYIGVDAVYTPVRNVNFRTEDVRVGKMTNFDKLIMDVTTDGTKAPEEAFAEAADILVQQFQSLTGKTAEEVIEEASAPVVEETDDSSVEE